jgi:ribosomal protein L37E
MDRCRACGQEQYSLDLEFIMVQIEYNDYRTGIEKLEYRMTFCRRCGPSVFADITAAIEATKTKP